MAADPGRERAADPLHAIVWSDDRGGGTLPPAARLIHPEGIAATLAGVLGAGLGEEVESLTAGLEDAGQGVSAARLARADVLLWWGHEAHQELTDESALRVREAVESGLGLVALHSAHHSKPFRSLMGTSCDLRWREAGDRELIWTVDPGHEIAAGVPNPIDLGAHETYAEPFAVPAPEELVFINASSGGEVFRGGLCYRRGAGRIFYFSPGHESDPVYANPAVARVIVNAARWARRRTARPLAPGGEPAVAVRSGR